MYWVIALSAVIATTCLTLYYADIVQNIVCMWTGVVFFTAVYHLWLRLIMGNLTKLFNIKYTMWCFKERAFKKSIYKFFHVKTWKNNVPTYNPELFSLKDYSLYDIANTMCKVETDHIVNIFISLSTLLFSILWGQLWIFALVAILAILFDSQFIMIQRYNRPRVIRILKRLNNHNSQHKKEQL